MFWRQRKPIRVVRPTVYIEPVDLCGSLQWRVSWLNERLYAPTYEAAVCLAQQVNPTAKLEQPK